jgi:glutamine amidotransferase-like uncharacterized protein
MPKVFIYNGPATSSASVDDLKDLFTDNAVVNKADICVSDLNHNFSGLNPKKDSATLVMPGGGMLSMSWALSDEQRKTLSSMNASGFNYLGVCAGAYMGTTTGCVFYDEFKKQPVVLAEPLGASSSSSKARTSSFAPPTLALRTEAHAQRSNLNFIDDHVAIGPFVPVVETYQDVAEATLHGKQYIPFCVDLETSDNQNLPQLYVGGCGLLPTTQKTNTEVIARYPTNNTYQFNYSETFSLTQNKASNIVEHTSLPAIIFRKREVDRSDRGSVILAGTHIEACVKNSKLLTFFKPGNQSKTTMNLSDEDYNKLQKSQGNAQKTMVALLNAAFNF